NSIANIQHLATVYPNTNSGNFTLEYKLPANAGEFRILDVMGKVVYTATISNSAGKQTLDASQLNNGIYFWEVFSGNSLVDKGKIAVMK
ncbi:MAG TPA: T9SS type A sorting domain-containing protein, partial [Bacteroidia bacterium]|nr:T9SS type A sorting domain-containing protein [Bacteroidia bacterium]